MLVTFLLSVCLCLVLCLRVVCCLMSKRVLVMFGVMLPNTLSENLNTPVYMLYNSINIDNIGNIFYGKRYIITNEIDIVMLYTISSYSLLLSRS
jgi:hypothetical protein